MGTDKAIDEVEGDRARAVGLFVLSDATIHEAASRAGITRWELEDALERAGLAEQFGIGEDADVTDTIDEIFENC